MKNNIVFVAAIGMVASVFVSSPVWAESEAVSASAEAVAQTVDEAADSVEEAVETVQTIGEELGVKDEAASTQPAASQPATTQPASSQPAAQEPPADQAMGNEAEAIAQWLAMNAPGEYHAKLEGFVGNWDVATKFWFAPGMPVQESTGSSQVQWILDGRFIQENFQGNVQMPGMEPQPFKGFGITGYDNMKKQYISIWSDTMSTGVMQSSGQYDTDTGVLQLVSNYDDPMTGQPTTMRMTHKFIDENTTVMEAFSKTPDTDEYQCMEITYTRKP